MKVILAVFVLLMAHSGFAQKPPSPQKPLKEFEVLSSLAADPSMQHSQRVANQVDVRGIDFDLTDAFIHALRGAEADDDLLVALRSAKVSKMGNADPAARSKYAQILQHVALGAELKHKERFPEASQQFQAALQLERENEALHLGYAAVLAEQSKYPEAIAEFQDLYDLILPTLKPACSSAWPFWGKRLPTLPFPGISRSGAAGSQRCLGPLSRWRCIDRQPRNR